MSNLQIGNITLTDYQHINILFGKNGCGKSTMLKQMTQDLRIKNAGSIQYITPERGGILLYQPGVEGNMQNAGWSDSVRNKNQFGQFKEQSVVIFKDLKAMINTQLENYILGYEPSEDKIPRQELMDRSFGLYISKINSLLDNIEIKEDKSTFKIYHRNTDVLVPAESISSGESELITLAIECLAYEAQCEKGKENFLFLDEPDVHIHPDLQVRLMHFLKGLVESEKLTILIATHSTALIGALEDYMYVGFNFFVKDKKDIKFLKVSEEYKSILPIFGAHPLSNIYCRTPLFLVEGDDDVWIWQKAIQTSGKLKIYPCGVSGDGNLLSYENKVNEIILSVYDAPDAKAYSLRDRDNKKNVNFNSPDRLPRVVRLILSCRCSENLLLSDDVLVYVKTNWDILQDELNKWLEIYTNHSKFKYMKDFKDSGFDRKMASTKQITNIITGMITSRPWQALVGQVIGEKIKSNSLSSDLASEHSIASYLGAELVDFLEKSCFILN